MAEEPNPLERWNYFNYFTEIEEHFQRARGTALFLMSPLDWALAENWKNAGVPLEAVLRGIEVAFEKWRAKKHKTRTVNSLAYCAQAVHEQMEAMTAARPRPSASKQDAPFTEEELRDYLEANAAQLLNMPGYGEIATALGELAGHSNTHIENLEELEQRLAALEDKMSAIARASLSDEELFAARRELDSSLRPYRGKMSAEQIAMLERQYLDRRIQEKAGLPRLSLFYFK